MPSSARDSCYTVKNLRSSHLTFGTLVEKGTRQEDIGLRIRYNDRNILGEERLLSVLAAQLVVAAYKKLEQRFEEDLLFLVPRQIPAGLLYGPKIVTFE